MQPPPIKATVPPSEAVGKPRVTWESLLDKPTSLDGAGLPLKLSDIPGQKTTTREFLRSVGTGTVAGAPTWDTIALADLPTNSAATRKFLRSVSSGAALWDTLVAADVPGDVAATRKFLRSLGTGSSAGATVWDTLTAADVGAGTFPAGNFTFQNNVGIAGVATTGGAATTGASAGDIVLPNSAQIRSVQGGTARSMMYLDVSKQLNLDLNGGILILNNPSTASSATAGTNGALPAQVAGYLVANIGGTKLIPYVNP